MARFQVLTFSFEVHISLIQVFSCNKKDEPNFLTPQTTIKIIFYKIICNLIMKNVNECF